MADNIITPEQVKESLNLAESALSHLSDDDEYQAAMLHNQAVMTQAIAALTDQEIGIGNGPAGFDLEDLPHGLAGKAAENINNGANGHALFSLDGTPYSTRVRATSDINQNETIVITGDDNQARPAPGTGEAFGALVGSGAGTFGDDINIERYKAFETEDLPQAGYPEDAINPNGSITLQPGDDVPLASTGSLNQGGYVLAVGATDETGVEYYLDIDGEYEVGGRTNSPLGTINSPFSFIKEFGATVPANSSAEYRAHYGEDESGEVELVGRLHVQRL